MSTRRIIAASTIGFLSGIYVGGLIEDSRKLEQVSAEAATVREAASDNAELDKAVSSDRSEQAVRDKVIFKEVVRYETITDAGSRCQLDGRWRLLHDAAATGQPADSSSLSSGEAEKVDDAAALATVAENYESCRENALKLEGWQSYWRDVVKGNQVIEEK